MGIFGKEGETLVLNAGHPLVDYVLAHEDGDDTKMNDEVVAVIIN